MILGQYVPLSAVEIVECRALYRARHAHQFGRGPIYVSPAMFSLIRHAAPHELKRLLQSIPLRRWAPGHLLEELLREHR